MLSCIEIGMSGMETVVSVPPQIHVSVPNTYMNQLKTMVVSVSTALSIIPYLFIFFSKAV